MAQLIVNVAVDGSWYGPDFGDPPSEVAAKITNPACWDTPPNDPPSTGKTEAGEGNGSPEDPAPSPADVDLERMDEPSLRGLAESLDPPIDLDGRWGEKRCRTELAKALAAR